MPSRRARAGRRVRLGRLAGRARSLLLTSHGGALAGLPRRAWLTLRWHGPATALWRALSFPLRFTPLAPRVLRHRLPFAGENREAARWYARHGRPVTIVIPTYGPPEPAVEAIASIRRTVDLARTRIVLVDDGSAPEHRARLERITGAEVVLADENAGFAANVNRGMRLARPGDDVVILNSDILAHPGWLERLQYAAYATWGGVGIVGPRLLYPDGRIQSAGSYRNLGAPEWHDHRYRFKPADFGPARVTVPALGMTGACLYMRRVVIDAIGLLDEGYGLGFEDMDYCLRAWQAGFQVVYYPPAVLTHLESATRGLEERSERELASQARFWARWGAFHDERDVRTPDGRLRIVYATEDTGVGGGHRVIFEHLNRLAARGHEVELWSLARAPDWFDLRVPVRTFRDYDALVADLAQRDAIKVATWWTTAAPVWRASVLRGLPVYFVQDIETSYYPGNPLLQHHVLASYREEFRYLTTSSWNRDQLAAMGLRATIVAPGVDRDAFAPDGRPRRNDVLLAVGRMNPLKNLPLTLAGWKCMSQPRPELWMFGIEPALGRRHGARYVTGPSDPEVNVLYNEATAFVQSSSHEGFCLPLLEAMAAGAPVVCTDAHGNRDFCRDGENCLWSEAEPGALAAALDTLFADPDLRARLAAEGLATAAGYAWEPLIDRLEAFYEEVAGAVATVTDAPRSAAPRG